MPFSTRQRSAGRERRQGAGAGSRRAARGQVAVEQQPRAIDGTILVERLRLFEIADGLVDAALLLIVIATAMTALALTAVLRRERERTGLVSA